MESVQLEHENVIELVLVTLRDGVEEGRKLSNEEKDPTTSKKLNEEPYEIQQKTETNPLYVLRQAICRVAPDIAVKARRNVSVYAPTYYLDIPREMYGLMRLLRNIYSCGGVASSSILVHGFSWLYGSSGGEIELQEIVNGLIKTQMYNSPGISIALIFIIVGIGFKLSPAPSHQWTPDVYEGVR
ncbi:hypothetical protein ACLOJK_035192, partial [Asimina triloba]